LQPPAFPCIASRFLARINCIARPPVWHHGQLQVFRWGNRRSEIPRLPCTAWTQIGTVESGGRGLKTDEIQRILSIGPEGVL
jgi:hypothetical protein